MEFLMNRSQGSYSELASQVDLQEDPMESPKEVLEGTPVVSSEMLSVGFSESGRVVARGVMSCTPGKFKEVVDDNEFFTVVSGRATLEVVDGPVLELEEGSVGEIRRGSNVVYTIHETLLKSFQLTMSEEGQEENTLSDEVKFEHEVASSNYCTVASSVKLELEPMEEGVSWVSSDPPPEITSTLLSSLDNGTIMRGIWRCSTGSCTYVEEDELFTVLAGQATVTVRHKSGSDENENETVDTLILRKGMIGEFKRGDIATFVVDGDEAFLKTFQITSSPPSTTKAK